MPGGWGGVGVGAATSCAHPSTAHAPTAHRHPHAAAHPHATRRSSFAIDLAFAIEPREEDTLPEVVLGSVRLSRMDVARPPLVVAEPTDWVLGTHGELHGDKEEES